MGAHDPVFARSATVFRVQNRAIRTEMDRLYYSDMDSEAKFARCRKSNHVTLCFVVSSSSLRNVART